MLKDVLKTIGIASLVGGIVAAIFVTADVLYSRAYHEVRFPPLPKVLHEPCVIGKPWIKRDSQLIVGGNSFTLYNETNKTVSYSLHCWILAGGGSDREHVASTGDSILVEPYQSRIVALKLVADYDQEQAERCHSSYTLACTATREKLWGDFDTFYLPEDK